MASVAKHVLQSALGIARMPSSGLLRAARRISTTSAMRADNRTLLKLKKLQADYQCEDGRPIYLKAGLRDRLLYGLVIVLCYIGIISVFSVIYDQAKPASWKTGTVC